MATLAYTRDRPDGSSFAARSVQVEDYGTEFELDVENDLLDHWESN